MCPHATTCVSCRYDALQHTCHNYETQVEMLLSRMQLLEAKLLEASARSEELSGALTEAQEQQLAHQQAVLRSEQALVARDSDISLLQQALNERCEVLVEQEAALASLRQEAIDVGERLQVAHQVSLFSLSFSVSAMNNAMVQH